MIGFLLFLATLAAAVGTMVVWSFGWLSVLGWLHNRLNRHPKLLMLSFILLPFAVFGSILMAVELFGR